MFNKNKIEFTPVTEAAKAFPPKPMKVNLPDWYKSMDNMVGGTKKLTARSLLENDKPNTLFTIKRCVPVLDYMMSGYMLYSNAEVLLSELKQNDDEQNFTWATPTEDTNQILGIHPYEQFPMQIRGKSRCYFKMYSGWSVKTPPGYSCLFMQPFYGMEDRFTLLPAIVDTDKYHDSVGFPGFLNDDVGDIRVDAGTPLMTVVPFKRDAWEAQINNHIYSPTEPNFGTLRRQYFDKIYRNFFNTKKHFD